MFKHFGAALALLTAAAPANAQNITAPNPQNPPFFVDSPLAADGSVDPLVTDDTPIHPELLKFGLAHDWAVYDGNHGDKIGARFSAVVLRWMAEHLDMGGNKGR